MKAKPTARGAAATMLWLWSSVLWSVAGHAASIGISDARVTEGGTAQFSITVNPRPATSAQAVPVRVATQDLNPKSAESGNDYAATSAALSFTRRNCPSSSATCTKTFSVNTTDDATPEATETFNVVLSNQTAGNTITRDTGVGTILDNDQAAANQPPTCSIDTPAGDVTVPVGSSVKFTATVKDPNNDPLTIAWAFPGGAPTSSSVEHPGNVAFSAAGTYSVTLNARDNPGGAACPQQSRTVTVRAVPNVSINSTGTDSRDVLPPAVLQQPSVANGSYSVLAINDLGMHCTDLDARVANILPPFQVLLLQAIQKGAKPTLNPAGISLAYSAVANPVDPILGRADAFNGWRSDGTTFKGFFAESVRSGSYDSFYPGINPFDNTALPKLSSAGLGEVTGDKGLPVPNTEALYIGADGNVQSGDETLAVSQQHMPGQTNPYVQNAPQPALEHYTNKPFFLNPAFKFGYVAKGVNWFEAAGIPMPPFDDAGRENPYPMVRVEANNGANVVSTVDTVVPVSAEASCTNCHADPADTPNNRSTAPTDKLRAAGLPVATSLQDPDQSLPVKVSREWAADVNILRLHDLKHGLKYVDTAGSNTPCTIDSSKVNGTETCLTNKALNRDPAKQQSIVCQTCHYTPALDLAQLGPLSGAAGTLANGRNQLAHQSNSRVMHNHHGQFKALFPEIDEPRQDPVSGAITNQAARTAQLEDSCYQCHPGKDTKCLRGAMFNGEVLCSDCHGNMQQVGDDFSKNVSPSNPGAFLLAKDFYTNPTTPRVPWANEPGCGSCHTGGANSTLANDATANNVMKNLIDSHGNKDGIRLRLAYHPGDVKATPIVPTDKRFAEPVAPNTFQASSGATPFTNPGAGNPQLYRLSTGHGGVMCEGCHGPTHAEWPVANPNANDNVTANQLQGHAGPISECATCHTNGSLRSDTQDGPHGMHLVNDSRFWREAHKDLAKRENARPDRGSCADCHGYNHEGTVLSRVPVDRSFTVEGLTRTVPAGTPVACDLCHSIGKSFGQ